jgi:hypothetical protein
MLSPFGRARLFSAPARFSDARKQRRPRFEVSLGIRIARAADSAIIQHYQHRC